MIPLQNHEEFEQLYGGELQTPVVIYFTAKWCGPCRGIDKVFLENEFKKLPMYICDVDENSYTSGFCGIRSIPSFMILKPAAKSAKGVHKNTICGPVQVSKTAEVATWIKTNLS